MLNFKYIIHIVCYSCKYIKKLKYGYNKSELILPFNLFHILLQTKPIIMKQKKNRRYVYGAAACLVAIIALAGLYFFTPFNNQDDTYYIYIDRDDTMDSIYHKLEPIASSHALHAMNTLMRHGSYKGHVRTGRYAIRPSETTFTIFRRIKNGLQEPVNLTIPSVRTLDRLAAEVSKRLMMDSTELYKALTDNKICAKYGYDTATIAAMFIPNTYDIYWNTTVDNFLDRMKKENGKVWNAERRQKAKAMNLTPIEVTTLASILDEETANNAEKPMVAGMYYNRLMLRDKEYPQGMPLQADPTIKFAWKDFGLRRIYHKLLTIDSPYNTYKYPGLPPGPIRIPSIAGIDAVLNHEKHNYLYMCAKEDFSGTHNFARTYQEHLRNAARYAKALNERGIK